MVNPLIGILIVAVILFGVMWNVGFGELDNYANEHGVTTGDYGDGYGLFKTLAVFVGENWVLVAYLFALAAVIALFLMLK
jgi:hypothetical protein